MSRAPKILLGTAVLCALGSGLYAQATTGRISGTVADSQGGRLPGAAVTVTETRTGISRSSTTDNEGRYVVVSLPVGIYDVAAELQGFKRAVKTGFTLVADGRVTADFILALGQVTETVTVTVAGETVNTTSGEIARVVDREQVQNLALNGRNYMQLTTLIPGAPLLQDDALNQMTAVSAAQSINGSRTNSNVLTVDGGFNMDSGSNASLISNVGIDFIEEVSIKTANFSAEYGRNSGANINVVTRSGGNQFRGSLFEYGRNDALDANDYFSNSKSVEKAPLRYHDFGWSLGGPVLKSKLFFFAGEEWKKIRRSTTPTLRTLPNSAQRNGDFSGTPVVIKDPLTGAQFPGNIIPPDRITPDGRAIANVYAAMAQLAVSYADTPTTNNALFSADNPFDFRQDMLRLDWQLNRDHRITARLINDNYDLTDPYGTFISSQLPTSPTQRKRPGRNYQLSHAWNASSNLINELKLNASWNSQRMYPLGDAWKRDSYGFVYPQLFGGGGRFENSIPDTSVNKYAGFNGEARAMLSPTTDIQASDNLTWLEGAHTVKLGGLLVRNRKDQNGRTTYAGSLAFNTTGNPRTTGDAFADALLGNFSSYSEAQYDPVGFFRFWEVEGFLTDNWRISRNLSVEYGVRYLWHQPMHTQANNMSSFVPALYDPSAAVVVNRDGTLVPGVGNPYNGMIRAGDGVPEGELSRVPNGDSPSVLAVPAGAPRGFYDNQNLFAPRFSFAWTPTGNSQTAVRGGVGLFYDRPEGNLLFGGAGNGPVNGPPYVVSSVFQNGNLSAPGGGSVPKPAPLGTIAAIDPKLKPPCSWNYSVSVQRQLIWGMFAEVGYVGSKGKNLLRQPDINQVPFADAAANAALPAAQRANTNFLRPYKGYSAIQMRVSDGNSTYNALQVFLSRREGLLRWTLSYTLSKSMDNASGNADNPEDYLNKSYTWGPSDYDRRHVLVGTWTWRLPFFKSQAGVGRVLGGWEVSGIARYQSGAPFGVTADTSIGNRRADYLGGDPYLPESQRFDPGKPGVARYLNPAAFAAAPESRRGNSGRNQFVGPDMKVVDLSLRKEFALPGTVRLQVQADMFNAFNQVELRSPNTNFSNAAFGQLTGAIPPRNVQLGARLTF